MIPSVNTDGATQRRCDSFCVFWCSSWGSWDSSGPRVGRKLSLWLTVSGFSSLKKKYILANHFTQMKYCTGAQWDKTDNHWASLPERQMWGSASLLLRASPWSAGTARGSNARSVRTGKSEDWGSLPSLQGWFLKKFLLCKDKEKLYNMLTEENQLQNWLLKCFEIKNKERVPLLL